MPLTVSQVVSFSAHDLSSSVIFGLASDGVVHRPVTGISLTVIIIPVHHAIIRR